MIYTCGAIVNALDPSDPNQAIKGASHDFGTPSRHHCYRFRIMIPPI